MTTTDTTTPIDPATAHEILASERRARVIEYLATTAEDQSEVPLEAIVDYLTEPQDDSRSVRVTLCHQHLPFLADVGVIEMDLDAGVVWPAPVCETLYRVQRKAGAVVGG